MKKYLIYSFYFYLSNIPLMRSIYIKNIPNSIKNIPNKGINLKEVGTKDEYFLNFRSILEKNWKGSFNISLLKEVNLKTENFSEVYRKLPQKLNTKLIIRDFLDIIN